MDIDAVPLLGSDRTSHVMGSRLCLAAVNTVWWRRGPAPGKHLSEYTDLTELVAAAGWLADCDALNASATLDPRGAARAVGEARDLREDLHAVFAATCAGEMAPADPLSRVQTCAARGLAELRLARRADGSYTLAWPAPTLATAVGQIATSAILLMSSAEFDRVKQCPGPTCGWVFLDSSRNRSRRWCSSAECGNRSRAQEHYRRTRALGAAAAGSG